MNLTAHFTLEELYKSDTAVRLGIINKAPPAVAANLMVLAEGLEKVRAILGKPLNVSSGYRCPALNAAVGGAHDSAHMQGFAADFTCWNFGSPESIVHVIQQSGVKFDQLIQEGTWVHISFAPTMRGEVLDALFDNKGKATYTKRAKS